MRRSGRAWGWLLAALASSGCAAPPEDDPVIVEIGGTAVTASEFDRYLEEAVGMDATFERGEVKSALLDRFIEERLLLRAAEEAGIEPEAASPAPGSTRAEPVNEGTYERIRRLLEQEVLAGIDVSDEEIAAYYEKNRTLYKRPTVVDVSQILVDTRERAEELRAELLRHPARFEELAEKYSIGPEASVGGRLGSFRRGELPPPFDEVVFALKKGQLSEVTETNFGYHIFRVNEIRAARELSLDEVRDSIRVELLRERSDRAVAQYVDGLRRRYPVKVYLEHLGFPHFGRGASSGAR